MNEKNGFLYRIFIKERGLYLKLLRHTWQLLTKVKNIQASQAFFKYAHTSHVSNKNRKLFSMLTLDAADNQNSFFHKHNF